MAHIKMTTCCQSQCTEFHCVLTVTIGGAVGHNKPLKHRRPKWKSDVRLTEAQLQQKRDEFWDTAPAFDGRAEIWDALKASVQALESGDHQLAQAILDGAGISLPNGTVLSFHSRLFVPASSRDVNETSCLASSS